MKKLFQRMDQGSREPTVTHTNYVGKVFTVGRHSVTVEDTIAEGGFALVFLVKGSGGVRYALKRLCVNSQNDLQVAKNEIDILKSLSGVKTVVGLVDFHISPMNGGVAGVHEVLILMTYFKKPLLHLLNDRLGVGLTEAEVLKIFCDVCDAVARLHQSHSPVIHRDLKIENILCGNDCFVLCDFGSATSEFVCPVEYPGGVSVVEEELARYTTLSYRAPEMVDLYAGNTISTKADIWALGCLLFKLCYFTLPFGESQLAITSGSFTFPTDWPVKYSPNLLSLIKYLLTPSPDARPDIFQTAAVAARISGRQSTVLVNPGNTVIPTEEQLLTLLTSSAPTKATPAVVNRQVSGYAVETAGTSVAPRQRPKAQGGKGLPPPGAVAVPALQPPPHTTPPPVAQVSTKRIHVKEDPQPEFQSVEQHSPAPIQTSPVEANTSVDPTTFPPSDLFGSGFNPPDSIAEQPPQDSAVSTEVSEAFFPSSGYPDPFVESEDPSTFRVHSSADVHQSLPHIGSRSESTEEMLGPTSPLSATSSTSQPMFNHGLVHHQYLVQGMQGLTIDGVGPVSLQTHQQIRNMSPPSSHMRVHRRNVSDVSVDVSMSPSNSKPVRKDTWNPFNDSKPFCQMTEDHIFDAEFDKIRRRPANNEGGDDDPFSDAPFHIQRNIEGSTPVETEGKMADFSPSEVLPHQTALLAASPPNMAPHGSQALLPPRSDTQSNGVAPPVADTLYQDVDGLVISPPPNFSGSDAGSCTSRVTLGGSNLVVIEQEKDKSNSEEETKKEVPFVLPPLEDRSKYEKFLDQNDDSDDEKKKNKLPLPPRKNPPTAPVKVTKDEIATKPPKDYASDDDSIGSAGDLKERIYDEYGEYSGTRKGVEDATETIGSSVYHAECESVTTHEEDPRITGTTDPAAAIKRGPKPSKTSLRARAHAKLEEKKKGSLQDRFLGHEFGEKPLLLDDELDEVLEDDENVKTESDVDSGSNSAAPSTEAPELINLFSPFPILDPNVERPPSSPTKINDNEEDVFALAPFLKPTCTTPNRQMCPYMVHKKYRKKRKPSLINQDSPREDPIYENIPFCVKCAIQEGEKERPDSLLGMQEAKSHNTSLSSSVNSLNNPFSKPYIHPENDEHIEEQFNVEESHITPPNNDLMSQSVDSLSSAKAPIFVNLIKTTSHSSTDLFGSEPFTASQFAPVSVSSTESVHQRANQGGSGFITPSRISHTSSYYASSQNTPVLNATTSTPRSFANLDTFKSVQPPEMEELDDEDLFESVPFKPILKNRSFLGLKSRTLPANMNSNIQSHMKDCTKEESSKTNDKFKSSKSSKKMTPPTFRKSKQGHKILSSDSESSANSSEVVISSKKSKSRDRSKDKLKYKNIKEEFEEENTMVLPLKQFSLSKKEKQSKKLKKLEKHDKKQEKIDKAEKKAEKKMEKGDKKSEKVDKVKGDKKSDKSLSYESAGISNMSFEDQCFEDPNNLIPSRDSGSEEDALDLRTTGGNRFGSLKRGINPFSKLSGRL